MSAVTLAHADRRTAGKRLRSTISRSAHAELVLPERDPVAVLQEQNATRLPDLVPIRIGRMLESPFAYYRGTTGPMAHDLAGGPATGVHVLSCGDAHLSNFGFYASPERRVLFDLNDFDESGDGPWEWDVKRLGASVHVAGRALGMSEEACEDATRAAVRTYRRTLLDLQDRSALERYYYRVEAADLEKELAKDMRSQLRRGIRKARRRTSEHVLEKITTRTEDGRVRIVDQPPVTQHVEHADLDQLTELFERYRETLREDVALLLSQFRMVDFVLRVVGVGSVGTRCYIILFEGPDGAPLVLQAKEAQTSVLATYGGMPDGLPEGVPLGPVGLSEGRRVVAAQRVLQAQSDPFLGWIQGWAGDREGRPRVDYYWRQFRDMKGSIDVANLVPGQLVVYVAQCGRLLARAHSQSLGGAAIRGYLGRSDRFDDAIARWSRRYADVVEADHADLGRAVAAGRLPAEHGA